MPPAAVAGVLTASILAINVLLHKPVLDALLFSLAIAVGITPQLLPAVISTSLAAGSRQMSRRKVLVKRLVCIEDRGDIDTLFTDKTATLTLGRISYMRAVPLGEGSSAAVLQWGVLRTETESMSGQAVGRNPLDQALWNSPASDGWLPGGFAGTIQRGLDRLTYGMAALLTPARQPIPLHDAIAKAGSTSFLLIAADRQPDETKAASYFRSAAPDRVDVT